MRGGINWVNYVLTVRLCRSARDISQDNLLNKVERTMLVDPKSRQTITRLIVFNQPISSNSVARLDADAVPSLSIRADLALVESPGVN